MISEALKPNVQDLQKDVIDLLEQISSLMNRASTALGSDSTGNKYGEFEQEVNEALENVENLELIVSIVAPMKAGKSTIINAIIGQEILPSRNAAMTTLPTELVFNAELKEPILTLSPKILSVFQETLLALQSKIQTLGIEGMQAKIAQYPHLVNLVQEIKDTVGFPTRARTTGREEIIKILTGLNDIIRLCSLTEPSKDPLSQLMDVPCIETPFWRSQNTSHNEKLGNLVIVDTPGPNEAGENLRLTAVVEEQLRKSSIVLIVLDFTQLKTKAAEEVKKEVQKVIQLRGKENLYVLVNKVDQRTEGDMTSEQVRQFVAAEFGIGDSRDKNRVFETAARWAFCATNFLLELQQYPDRDLEQMITARALAQQALGARWETKLKKEATVKKLQDEAEYLWEESGFAPFLDRAIDALMESAAPRCMRSALNLSRSRLMELRDDMQLRSSAIAEDAEKLQYQLDALDEDLSHLDLCRNRLKEVDTIKRQLNQNLNELLEVLKKEAQVSIEDYFVEKDIEHGNLVQKADIKARQFFLTNISDIEIFPKWISQQLKSTLEYKTSGVLVFESEIEAEEFANQAIAWAKRRAETLLSVVRENTGKEVEKARTGLSNFLEQETKPIIERARTRLNEAFNVDLSLPAPNFKSNEMDIWKPRVRSQSRYVEQGYEDVITHKRVWWNWLWIVPVEVKEKKKRPDKREDYYTVSLEELVTQINKSIEASVDSIHQGISKYLDEDFQQQVGVFFEKLDSYLSNYRDSLKQAQADQKLLQGEKEKLVKELNLLVPDAISQIKQANTYLERIDKLMLGE